MGKKKQQCPVCHRPCGTTTGCRVDADGNSGHCRKTIKKTAGGKRGIVGRWKLRKVPASDLVNVENGPIQHDDVPDWLLEIMRWTYRITGRFVQPTCEQWEVGFMRDLNIEQEVMYWHRLSFAFIDWHRRKGVELRSDAEERKLIGEFITINQSSPGSLAKRCWMEPKGWDEETSRTCELLTQRRWTPPPGLETWPN